MKKNLITLFFVFAFVTVVFFKQSASVFSLTGPKQTMRPIEKLSNGDIKQNTSNTNIFNPQIVLNDYYDDILEPGFPVQIYHSGGTYHGGQAINTLVANIGGSMEEEIIVTGLATGPLYAFDSQGNLLNGWPVQASSSGANYAVYGDGIVAFGNFGDHLKGVDYTGTQIWERLNSNYVSTPGSAAYSSVHNTWGFYIGEENGKMNGYNISNGNILAGWPTNYLWGGQERHTPAIYDIDNDGENEIISVSGTSNGAVNVTAVNQDASVLWNYEIAQGEVDTFPVIGDVDGDGQVEIVVMGSATAYPWYQVMYVINTLGAVERTWTLNDSTGWGSAPALADLDGDDIPEIVVQTDLYIFVTDGFGNSLSGWPYYVGDHHMLGNSSPVVGDVDADYLPEVVFTSYNYYEPGSPGYLYVLNHDGTVLNENFPMYIEHIGHGAVPAISDIDLDCHNEIIITGSFWNGQSGYYPKVWAFDISKTIDPLPGIDKFGIYPNGDVEWEQFMSNENHTGVYSPKKLICIHDTEVE